MMSFPPHGRHTGMSTIETTVAAATAGDESAFTALVERYRSELRVHCYRMLGSLDDSEDAVQETFLRAWRRRSTCEGRSTFRAWLYRIATNACLDALERRPAPAAAEVPWLQPYPDRLLDDVAVDNETIELAFLVAIQHLAPRPRAVLLLRDVLGWPAKDAAGLLGTSVAAVNSALQRARAGLREHLPERRVDWAADAGERERALVRRYVDATEHGDAAAVAALLRDDARFSMPPIPGIHVGRDAIVAYWAEEGFGTDAMGAFRCAVTRANRQPAVACYLREPGDSEYRAMALDVLRVEDGAVAEITTFVPEVFGAFGLPPTL
jgi:RNA polymerase sigma-70 factor (ECF subfamily)